MDSIVNIHPLRRYVNHVGADIDNHFQSQIQRLHTGRRYSRAIKPDGFAMQSCLVFAQRLVQGAVPAHIGNVERQPVVKRLFSRISNEGWCDHIAFAIP